MRLYISFCMILLVMTFPLKSSLHNKSFVILFDRRGAETQSEAILRNNAVLISLTQNSSLLCASAPLRSFKTQSEGGKNSSQETFFLDNISKQYDVKFTISCKNFSCEGEGIITLLQKNTDSVAFQFSVKNCAFTLRKLLDSLRSQNKTDSIIHLSNVKSSIICNDFDFDGNDDFAVPIRNPHKTLKDKTTFDIFLFDVAEQRYKLHKELTAIQHTTASVLDADNIDKKVYCYRQYDPNLETVKAYIWIGKGTRKRLQIVLDWQNDTSKIHPIVTKTTYSFVKGTWVKKTTRRVKFRNDCE